MRAVQVSFHNDPQRRRPDALLDAWPTLAAVAVSVAAAGVDVTVVQAAASDAEFDRDGVHWRFVAEAHPSAVHRRLGLWAAPGGERVAAVVEHLDADVVHVHGLGFPRQTARIRVQGRPVLVQDHADRPPPKWAASLWRRALEGVAVAFTARDQARPFVEAGALAPDARVFEVLESSSTFTPGDRAAARRRSGLHGEPCCIWLGRLDANKDPLTALDAFERVARTRPDARLWMYWQSGDLEASVRARVSRSPHLRDVVHPCGSLSRDGVQDALRAADLFVQASHREGSGYALLEALACGAVPVVTDIPSFRRISGPIGTRVPPGHPLALAEAILAADWSEERRREVRAHFERSLDFRAVARELIGAWEAIT